MKLLRFIILICLAVTCVHADVIIDASSDDELDVGFYGIDVPDETDSPAEPVSVTDAEEDEVQEDEEPTTTPRPTRRGGSSWERGGRGRSNHHSRGHGRHHHRRGGHHWGSNWTSEQKLNFLCNRLESGSSSDWMERKFQHKFSGLTDEQKARVQEVMLARKADMAECCQLTDTEEREQCADNLREMRYERVCNGEEPLQMWAELQGQSSQSSEVVDRCCALPGPDRATCFTEAKHLYFRGHNHRDRERRRRGPSQ